MDGLQQTLAGLKETDRQVNVLRENFRGLTKDALEAKAAMQGFGISDSAIVKQAALNDEMRKTRDLALEIRAASGGGGIGGSGGGFSGVFGGGGRNTEGLARAAEAQFRRDLSTGGIIGGLFGAQEARRLAQSGISAEAGLIPSGDLRGEFNRENYSLLRDALRARRAASSGGGSGGGFDRGALFGLLPGGARPSQAALTTLLGLAVGGAPAIAPGILAAAPIAGAGIGGLLGAAGTLKLAFDGITSAAFTTQQAFDKLTPVQQQFVQTLRSLDAGLGAELKGIAQNTLLPQLSAALHTAFTPGLTSALSGGVGAFSNSIGGGAQQFAGLLGGSGKGFGAFPAELGTMLKQDAGYLSQFFTVLTHLTDAFVHFQVAAGPFLKWFGDLNVQFSKYVDNAIQADQANGRLAHFFDIIQTSLQTTGTLLASVGHLASAFVDAIGFQNSVALVNTLSRAVNGLATFLKANSRTFQDFFAGAIISANDVLDVIRELSHALTPLLSLVDQLAKAFGGFRTILDAVIAYQVANWVLGIGIAATTGAKDITLLKLAIEALSGSEVLAAIAAVAGPIAAIVAGIVLIEKYSGSGEAQNTLFNRLMVLTKPGPNQISTQTVQQILGQKEITSAQAKSLDNAINGISTIPRGVTTGLASTPFAATPVTGGTGTNAFSASGLSSIRASLTGLGGSSAAFGTSGALAATAGAGFQLPNAYQLAIAKASATPGNADDARAIQSAITYLKGAVGKLSPTDQTAAYGDLASLEAQLASITKSVTAPGGATALGNILAVVKHVSTAVRSGTTAAATAESDRVNRILGIGGNGIASSASITARERSILTGALGRAGLGTGAGESVGEITNQLRAHGDLPKSTLDSLKKINEALNTGIKLTVSQTQNVTQRLDQINTTLKENKSGFSDLNAVASTATILRASGAHITGTAAQRGKAFQDLNEELQRRGTLSHAGGGVLGIPLTHGGRPALTSHHTIEVKVSAADGARLSAEAADMIAQKVGKIFLGSRNRNTTQLTGKNAGRPIPGF